MNLHSLFCDVDLLEVEVELLEEEVGVDVAKHRDLKKAEVVAVDAKVVDVYAVSRSILILFQKKLLALKLRTRSLRIHHHFILSGKSDLIYLMAVRPPLTSSSFFLLFMRSIGSFNQLLLMLNIRREKREQIRAFCEKPLTHAEVMAFWGVLVLLGIHSVRNYLKAFSESRTQVLIRLHNLMTCQRFKVIGIVLFTL